MKAYFFQFLVLLGLTLPPTALADNVFFTKLSGHVENGHFTIKWSTSPSNISGSRGHANLSSTIHGASVYYRSTSSSTWRVLIPYKESKTHSETRSISEVGTYQFQIRVRFSDRGGRSDKPVSMGTLTLGSRGPSGGLAKIKLSTSGAKVRVDLSEFKVPPMYSGWQLKRNDWSRPIYISSRAGAVYEDANFSASSHSYRARVVSVNGAGNPNSLAQYPWQTSSSIKVPQVPGPVRGLTGPDTASFTTGAYTLNWSAPNTGGAVGRYEVKDGGNYVSVGGRRSHSNSSSESWAARTIYVRACNSAGCGAPVSRVVLIRTNKAPKLSVSPTGLNTDGEMTFSIDGLGRINGRFDADVWLSDGGRNFKPMSVRRFKQRLPREDYDRQTHYPLTVSTTREGRFTYYAVACVDGQHDTSGVYNKPNTGSCARSQPVSVQVNFPTPGKPSRPRLEHFKARKGYNTSGQLRFKWQAEPLSVKYVVTLTPDGGNSKEYEVSGDLTEFLIGTGAHGIGPLPDNSYTLSVKGCNKRTDARECGQAASISFTVLRRPEMPVFTLVKEPNVDGELLLTWSVADDPKWDYYELSIGNADNFQRVGKTNRETRSISETTEYWVRACNAADCGPSGHIRVVVDSMPKLNFVMGGTLHLANNSSYSALSLDGNITLTDFGLGDINEESDGHNTWLAIKSPSQGVEYLPVYVYNDGDATKGLISTSLAARYSAGVSANITETVSVNTQEKYDFYLVGCVNPRINSSGIPQPPTRQAPAEYCVEGPAISAMVDFPVPEDMGYIRLDNVERRQTRYSLIHKRTQKILNLCDSISSEVATLAPRDNRSQCHNWDAIPLNNNRFILRNADTRLALSVESNAEGAAVISKSFSEGNASLHWAYQNIDGKHGRLRHVSSGRYLSFDPQSASLVLSSSAGEEVAWGLMADWFRAGQSVIFTFDEVDCIEVPGCETQYRVEKINQDTTKFPYLQKTVSNNRWVADNPMGLPGTRNYSDTEPARVTKYRVYACNIFEECSEPREIEVHNLSAPRHGPEVEGPSHVFSSFSLEWNLGPDFFYEIFDERTGNWEPFYGSQGETFDFPDGEYSFEVRACNFAGCSARTLHEVMVIKSGSVKFNYEYDDLGRLRKVLIRDKAKTTYEYDLEGNREEVRE